MKKLTTEEFIQRAIGVHGNKYGYSDVVYINSQKKVKIWCNIHKSFFMMTPNNHLNNHGCPICRYINSSKSNTRLLEDFIIDAIDIHGDKYGYDDVIYKHSKQKVKIYCKRHKQYFWQSPNGHLHGYGCPICRESKGEKEIRKYLDKNNVQYIAQKRFNDCKDKISLPFDFYLPKNNVCIEYQGIQHYELVKGMGNKVYNEKESKENFNNIRYRDKIKKDYCLLNDIIFIEISYLEFNHIEKKINEQLLSGVI